MRMLLQTSFEVVTVASVDEALQSLTERYPDAMVMDLHMPSKDGLQGLREIRPLYPSLPILMLTGYADDVTTHEALTLGASQLMRKPFDLVQLLTLLTDMAEGRETVAMQAH